MVDVLCIVVFVFLVVGKGSGETEFCFMWSLAVGWVRGVFCMLGSYESATPYGTSAFYRLFISHSVLKICSVKVRPRPPK